MYLLDKGENIPPPLKIGLRGMIPGLVVDVARVPEDKLQEALREFGKAMYDIADGPKEAAG